MNNEEIKKQISDHKHSIKELNLLMLDYIGRPLYGSILRLAEDSPSCEDKLKYCGEVNAYLGVRANITDRILKHIIDLRDLEGKLQNEAVDK